MSDNIVYNAFPEEIYETKKAMLEYVGYVDVDKSTVKMADEMQVIGVVTDINERNYIAYYGYMSIDIILYMTIDTPHIVYNTNELEGQWR